MKLKGLKMKKLFFLLFMFESMVAFSQEVTVIEYADISGGGYNENYYITLTGPDKFPSLFDIESQNSTPLQIEEAIPINLSYFPSNDDRFYIITGGSWVNDPKHLIEFNTADYSINWVYQLPGDFVTNLSLLNDHLYATMRNNGALLDFNLTEQLINSNKIFDSAIYHVYKINDDEIFTNGANNYNEGDYAIKILNNDLTVKDELKGFSDSYSFKHNGPYGYFLTFSHNQYLDPDDLIHIYDYSLNEISQIKLDDRICDVSFSFDNQSILVGHGYDESSKVSVFSLKGDLISTTNIEMYGSYERIVTIFGNQSNFSVVLGESER